MGTLGYVALVVVGLLGLLAILNWRSFARLFGAASVQAGKVGRWAAEADPLAVFKERIDNGLDNISKAKKSLEGSAALVRTVQRQVDEGEKEQKRLSSRIKAAVDAGDPNNTATDYALQLAQVESNLESNKTQLARHKENHENFKNTIINEQRKVEAARREAASLGQELDQSEREKEFANYASDVQAGKFDTTGLDEAKEAVRRKIDQNRAAGDVARDLGRQGAAEAADEELERKAAAADILARFKKPAE